MSHLQTEALDEGVFRTDVSGGPLVLSERMDSVRSVAVGLWIRQGAAFEASSLRGVSHFLEHAVFKGTKHRSPRELAGEIERVGGSLDAYTTHDHTGFVAHVPDRYLEGAIDVLCDLVFAPALDEAQVALERKVILEEIASVEDTPEQLVFDRHALQMYGNHPYGAPVLGTCDTVGTLGSTDLRSLHQRSYRPSNAVVASAGRVNHLELVEALTELLSRTDPVRQTPLAPARPAAPGVTRMRRPGGTQTHIVAGGITVPYAHHLRHAIVVAETALGAGMSSRLFQRVREDLGLAYSVYSFSAFHEAGGHAGAYAGTRPETGPAALDALLMELRTFAENGLDPLEVEATKEQLKGQLMVSMETPGARRNRLATLALYDESYKTLEEVAQRIDAVTADDLAAACALFHPDRLSVLELSPV